MKTLRISDDLSLPLEIVTQTIGLLAKRRAGKSYLLRRLIEQLFKAGQQVVIVDPKGDQWGVRSAADGKAPGLPIVHLGGERGDVPLEPSSGEIVAKLVVEERVSALLDLSLFRKHELATFMADFLEQLYRLKAREMYRTPLMLGIDEADAIAPQSVKNYGVKGGNVERMLGAAEDIVRRGGQRGIGCILATQRSAVLNKNVLTQAQVMIALRTIAPQDLDAMNAWIDVHGTEEQKRTLMASLPSLPVGDAWFWSPGWPTVDGIFKRVHVEPIETFDSMATPKPGEKRVEPKTVADVDLDALRRQMADTIERAKERDPREIRRKYEAQITELRKQLAAKPTAAPAAAKEPKFDPAKLRAMAQKAGDVAVAVKLRPHVATGRRLLASINASLEKIAKDRDEFAALIALAEETVKVGVEVPEVAVPRPIVQRPAPPPRMEPRVRAMAPTRAESNGDSLPSGALRRIMVALAQHPEGLNYRKIGVFSGVSTRGGSFSTYLSRGRTHGWLEGGDAAGVMITNDGLAALGDWEPLPTGLALCEYWLDDFGRDSACGRILQKLVDAYPDSVDAEELGRLANVSTKGGSWSTYLSRLRSRDLITGSSGGKLRAAATLLGFGSEES